MNNKTLKENEQKGLEMYFSPKVAEKFAELEQNEKNYRVAEIVDRIILQETKDMPDPICAAELGGGAHPDRYHGFFKKLLEEPRGRIDWVDISPYMLELAKKYIENEKYQDRKEVIDFIKIEILEYLRNLENEKLDLAIMKYVIDYIKDVETLFKLLSEKTKLGGKFIATIGNLSPELKGCHTNARFLYNGKQFPDDETRALKDGDNITVKFFNIPGDPNSGYLEGAETVKHFHSAEKIEKLAKSFRFDIFLGDWKDFIGEEEQEGEKMDQDILVLTKK